LPSIWEKYQTDHEAELGGIDVDLGDGQVITVRRAGGANKQYQARLRALAKPYQRQVEIGTIDPGMLQRITMQAFAESSVVGWRGITDPDGKEIPFSPPAALELFKALPDLFDAVFQAAGEIDSFRAHRVEQTGKNSSTSSSGTSSGEASPKD
jgi:hypothetical protein